MTAYLYTPQLHAQIVDALEKCQKVFDGFANGEIKELPPALAMLKAMKPQEPVAWMQYVDKYGDYEFNKRREDCRQNRKAEPLYTLGDTE